MYALHIQQHHFLLLLSRKKDGERKGEKKRNPLHMTCEKCEIDSQNIKNERRMDGNGKYKPPGSTIK